MVKIYVEGIADVVFLRQYIKKLYDIELDKDSITYLDGWTNIKNDEIITQFKKNSDDGVTSLVIFDADNDPKTRRIELQNNAVNNNISYEIFLFPNDVDNGALEDLLMRIINNDNKAVSECWDRYEDDLGKQIISWKIPPKPTIPSIKTRVYAYLEALVGESKSQKNLIKERNRLYTDKNHWDLDSQELNPLKSFLDRYFSNINEV